MHARRTKSCLIAGALLLGLAMIAAVPAVAPAQTQADTVEGMGYNVEASMSDNLKALGGKKVYVTLKSGKTLAGTIGRVSTGFLHLEQLEGREYFDALIRIDDISAIDARFRMPKR
jgi:hypothetical protein